MEIFADFGLFELVAVLGLSALARALYSRRLVGFGVLLLSVAAPLALVVLVQEGPIRWLAAVSLGTALVNATVVLGAVRTGSVSRLLAYSWRRRAQADASPLAPEPAGGLPDRAAARSPAQGAEPGELPSRAGD